MDRRDLAEQSRVGKPRPTVTFSAEDVAAAHETSKGSATKRNADGLTDLQLMGAQLEAMGMTSEVIARQLGILPTSVRRWRMDINYKRAVMVEKWQILGDSTPEATDVLTGLLYADDPDLQFKVAAKILELGGMGMVPALLIGKTQEESTVRVVLDGAPRPERQTDSEEDEDDGVIEAEYAPVEADYDAGDMRDAADWECARHDGEG